MMNFDPDESEDPDIDEDYDDVPMTEQENDPGHGDW
jgi:hypothetical protein